MSPRQSAAVYRRRRIVFFGTVIVVLVVLIVLVWTLIARSWTGGDAPSPAPSASAPSPSPSASPSASPSPSPSPSPEGETPPPAAETAACTAQDVEVKAVTDAESYAADALPQLSISLTNKSAKDCTINVGTTTQKFTITSGSDTWWRSTDCQQNPSDMINTLKAGTTVTSAAPVTWDRTRSSVDTCGSGDRPKAPGGGATYHLTVSIGGFDSAGSSSFILN